MARLADRSTRRDRFHQKAKREGFAARAVYKLEELDARFHLLRPGLRVLDLGCAPGSWLQYARSRIGDAAALVGIDRVAPKIAAGARVIVGDVMTVDPAELRGELPAFDPTAPPFGGAERRAQVPAFDVVLSDMAPDTTGIRHVDQARSEVLYERALELACALLAPSGDFVAKLFQGPEHKRLVDAARARFATVKIAKPESSRQISIEQYVVAKGFSPPSERAREEPPAPRVRAKERP